MINKKKTVFLKTLYFLFFIFAALLTFQNTNFKFELGQVLGVWGLTALSLQPLLASRWKVLERGVGLPQIVNWHSFNAKLMLIFVLGHPLLVLGIPPWKLSFAYSLGAAALISLLLVITTTIFSRKLNLNYEVWKIIHKIGYLIVVLGFIHSFLSGSDILARGPLFYWWILLLGIAVFGVSLRLTKLWFGKAEYRIDRVVKETRSVYTIIMKPKTEKVFAYSPGQFAFVRFVSKNVPSEEHHFTISSSPKDDYLSFTIKSLGDFTSLIGKLKEGDKAMIDGPYGVFTYSLQGPSPQAFLFIAGGIGITPIRSMLRSLNGKKSVLIYTAKDEQDFVFDASLKKLLGSKYYKFVSNRKGHLTGDNIKKLIPDFTKRKIFICGPAAMIESLEKELPILGVKKENMFSEKFSLR